MKSQKIKIKKILKVTALIIVVALVAVQLIPKHNDNDQSLAGANFIGNKYVIPANVEVVLKKACYDCHSNNTRYPWYTSLQPVSYWLNDHIDEGKSKLNFSEFLTYPAWKQFHRMEDIEDEIKTDGMPLSSYTLIHRDAVIDDSTKNLLINWSKNVREMLKQNYPADSLVKPKKNNTTPKA